MSNIKVYTVTEDDKKGWGVKPSKCEYPLQAYKQSGNKAKILLVGDHPLLHTGFASIVRHVAYYLQKSNLFDVSIIGWYWPRDPQTSRPGVNDGVPFENTTPWKIFPTEPTQNDQFSQVTFPKVMATVKPEIVWAIGDEWMVRHIGQYRHEHPGEFVCVLHLPIDGSPLPSYFIPTLRSPDALVLYGNYGYREVMKLDPKLRQIAHAIPHGIDCSVFRPLDPEQVKMFRLKIGWADKKIIGGFYRNQPRKFVSRMLEIFSMAIRGTATCGQCGHMTYNNSAARCENCLSLNLYRVPPKDDLYFYLHHAKHDVGMDALTIASRYGVQDRLLFPSDLAVGVGVQESDLVMLMNACDFHATATSGEGFCAVPGTLVDTPSGPVAIDDLRPGDMVMTHRGRSRSVIKTMSRHCDELIVRLRAKTYSRPLLFTNEHPFYCVKRNNRKFKYVKQDIFDGERPEWVEAQDIEVGDFLVCPKLQDVNSAPKIKALFVSDYVDGLDVKDGRIQCKMSFDTNPELSLCSIAETLGVSFKSVSRVLNEAQRYPNKKFRDGSEKQMILEYCNSIGYSLPECRTIPNEIELTDDLMFAFGLFIAEGDSSGGKVTWNLNSNEDYGASVVFESMLEAFEISAASCPYNHKHVNRVYVCNRTITRLFRSLFGVDALTKRIPEILIDAKNVNSLIRGIFCGDGTTSGGSYSFSTSSRLLAWQIRQICLKNGIPTRLGEDNRSNNCNYTIHCTGEFGSKFFESFSPIKYGNDCLSPNREDRSYYIEDDDHFYVPVVSVSSEPYNGLVYNIQVEEDESYTSQGVAVHNCLPIAEGMACGKTVLAPNFSAYVDDVVTDNQNGLLVPVQSIYIEETLGIGRAVVNCHAFAQAIDRCYYDDPEVLRNKWRLGEEVKFDCGQDMMRRIGLAAIDKIRTLDWSSIGPQWVELLANHTPSLQIKSAVKTKVVNTRVETKAGANKLMVIGQRFDPPGGGTEWAMLAMLQSLAPEWASMVVSNRHPYLNKPHVMCNARKIDDVLSVTVNNWGQDFCGLKDIAKWWRPDAVLIYNETFEEGMAIAREFDIPLLIYMHSPQVFYTETTTETFDSITKHGSNPYACRDQDILRRREAAKQAFEMADTVVCNSLYTKAYMKNLFGRCDAVVPPFIHRANILQPTELRERAWIGMTKPQADKGASLFLAIAAMMPDLKFCCLGSCEERSLAQALNAAPNIVVLSGNVNTHDFFAGCKLVLQPSVISESFGLTAMEAILSGIPVLVSGNAGFRESARFKEFLVDNYLDPKAWVQKIRWVLGAQENYEDMLDCCAARAKQYTLEIQQGIEDWRQILSTAIREGDKE